MSGRIELLYIWFVLLIPLGVCGQIDTISVFFDTDKSNLKVTQRKYIDSLFKLVREDLVQGIELIGQADHRGSLSYNLELSQRRAHSVASYFLSEYPALKDKIQPRGIGEQENLSNLSNSRRVDVIINRKHPEVRLKGTFRPSTIPINELSIGNILSITGLNFHDRRSVLLPKSIPHLKDLEKILIEHPNVEIEIQGHVCCPDHKKNGSDGFNMDTNESNLSLTRAKNIYDYLVRKGIDAQRLKYKGLGASNPLVYPEETEDDRMKNRRVELLITKL